MNILIGVTGKARAGKDTFAKGLVARGFQRVAFADPLKYITAHIADEPSSLYHDDVTKEEYSEGLGMTRRKGLQLLGTEGVRNVFGPDIWANRALRRWVRNGRPNTVITDVRFDNEADLIIAHGGFVVRIVRPGHDNLVSGAAGHVSEQGVSDERVLITVENSGTVEQLMAMAAEFTGGLAP